MIRGGDERRRGFTVNVGRIASGSAAAQLLVLLSTPWLTRIFDPEDFGVLAVFAAFVTVVSSVATGRYELAVPLARDDRDAATLMSVALRSGAVVSVAAAALLAVTGSWLADLVRVPSLAPIAPLAAVAVLAMSGQDALRYWATRRERYGALSVTSVVRSASTVGAQVALGLVFSATTGQSLVVGQVIGLLAGLAVMAWRSGFVTDRRGMDAAGGTPAAELRRTHAELPRHAMSTSFLNSVSTVSLPVAMSAVLGPGPSGVVLLAQRLVVVPMQIVGQATWQVTHARIGPLEVDARTAALTTLNRLATLAYAFPLAAVAVLAESAPDLLGDRWGPIADVLPPICLMVFTSSVSNATSYFAAFERYRDESVANVVLVTVRLASLVGSALLGAGLQVIVWSYCLGSSAAYLGIYAHWGRILGRSGSFWSNLVTAAVGSALPLLGLRWILDDRQGVLVVIVVVLALAHAALVVRLARRSDVVLEGRAT